YFDGTDGPDFITATSTNADVTGSVVTNDGGSNKTVKNVDFVNLRGLDGNDTIDAGGITVASGVGNVGMLGGEGDDHLTAGIKPGSLFGNEGTNTLTGGLAVDTFISYSETDTIEANGAGADVLYDGQSGRSGGRTITGSTLYAYEQDQDGCDAQSRVRPDPSGTKVISSLCRPGTQTVPFGVSKVRLDFDDAINTKALADLTLQDDLALEVDGDAALDDLVDVTIQTGGWTVSESGGTTTIDPAHSDYANVTLRDIGTTKYLVHNPWSDKNQGFGHRVIRDLLFRFPSAAERDGIRSSLANGSKTRAQVVAGIMNTDEYRGNDVDRVFVRFLRRTPDPSGRAYWINALRNGRSLQKFRAQLFGSNEYFVKAGNTNASFVRAAYFDVLGRLPDPSGEAYWTKKIDNGADRGSVANAFLASTEARRAIVKDQYQRFALRLPTTTESEQWVGKLAGVTGERDLIAFLAASTAYYDAG
ncbi:MAG: DUF4214 domain-containing protein, partial [Aquihabitans sp.]